MTTTAEIYITKLAACRRLLRTAIRLHFQHEDELAVHAVAAAGYSIIRELKRTRGQDEYGFIKETEIRGYLELAKKRMNGQLPVNILSEEHFLGFLDQLAEKANITKDTDISQLKFDVTFSSGAATDFRRNHNKTFNFLKHATRDSDEIMSLDDIDNFTLLARASVSYMSIAPDDLGNEGLVFQLYLSALGDDPIDSGVEHFDQISLLREMSPDDRVSFCAELITQMS